MSIDHKAEADMWNTDCLRCDGERSKAQNAAGDWFGSITRRMIVCPTCGNKRCPKATWHDNNCTGSNETGQEGSDYAKFVDDGRTREERIAAFFASVEDEAVTS